MYKIYADDLCIYNDTLSLDDMIVIDPKLSLSDNNAGSFIFTLPPSNKGYDVIQRIVTKIRVVKDNIEIWEGRVLSEKTDFWNCRAFTCEGELAYLNDSTQPPAEYHDISVRGFLETLINIHNSKVSDDKKFEVGVVTVTDPNDSLYRYTNYEKTIECINNKLIDSLGGHLRIRKVDGVRYLDYLADYPNTNSQTIEFAKNLLDFTKTFDMTEFATVILPKGARLDTSPIGALEAYLTVESVNDGSIYVTSEDAVAEYGWIEKVVSWDNVTTPSILLSKAKKYLSEIQFDNMTLELSAVDLHYLDVNIESVSLLDEIRVISKPHGLDRLFPVTRLEIPLDRPENAIYELGDGPGSKTSLTEVNNAINTGILSAIENIPSKSSILKEAQSNATQLITDKTNGYVTIIQGENNTTELVISDEEDYTKANKIWRFNVNGLGYSSNGYNGPYNIALTMDGHFVADAVIVDGLEVGKNVTMGPDAKIAWSNVTDKGNVSDLVNDSGYVNSDTATQITKDTVTTQYVNALGVRAGSVAAESITGTTISGKVISASTITGSDINGGTITGAKVNANGIEAYGDNGIGQPYIDFHWYGDKGDYTGRILEATAGSLKAYNSISNASDRRLKKNIVDVDDRLLQLFDLIDPKQYRFIKGDEYLKIGFIAQDIDEALSEIGIEDKPIISQDPEPDSKIRYYAVDYNDLIALLWKKVQSMQNEINSLKEDKLNG